MLNQALLERQLRIFPIKMNGKNVFILGTNNPAYALKRIKIWYFGYRKNLYSLSFMTCPMIDTQKHKTGNEEARKCLHKFGKSEWKYRRRKFLMFCLCFIVVARDFSKFLFDPKMIRLKSKIIKYLNNPHTRPTIRRRKGIFSCLISKIF